MLPFFRIAVFLILTLKGVSTFYAIVVFISDEFLAALVSIKFLFDRISSIGKVKLRFENKNILDVAYTIIFTSMIVLLYTQADI